MDVRGSEELTSLIADLREKIYNTNEFTEYLDSSLKKIFTDDIELIKEPTMYGGYTIYIKNSNSDNTNVESVYNTLIDAIGSSMVANHIHILNWKIPYIYTIADIMNINNEFYIRL